MSNSVASHTLRSNYPLFTLAFFLFQSFNIYSQSISSFSPKSQLPGKNVTINGSGFGTNSANVTVKFGGVTGTISSISSNSIIATVPSGATTGKISVKVGTGSEVFSTDTFVYIEVIDQLYTDYSGYWTSSNAAVNNTQPDLSHNLIAFKYGNTLYSTGVSDTILSNRSISFTSALWNAFPVDSVTGVGTGAVLLWAAGNDGRVDSAINPLKKIKDVLIDGKRGLDIGTGIANFTSEIDFTVTDIDVNKISDTEPDILITQVADPSGSNFDRFWFIDNQGNRVGSELTAMAQDVLHIGTYKLDLWFFDSRNNNNIKNSDAISSTRFNNIAPDTRPIRLFAYKLSDFGITSSNYSAIDKLRFKPGGQADYAFVAYNANTFIVPTAQVGSQPVSTTACAGSGSSATFSVSATNPSSVGSSGGTITYQWKKNGNNIAGATADSYTISPITAADFGEYVCEITNNFGSILSDPAYLNVRITLDPVNGTNCINTTATALNLTAIGNSPTYQWYSNSTNSTSGATLINGATSNSYTPASNTAGNFYYFCIVADPNISGCTIEDTSNVVLHKVDPASVGGSTSGNQTICWNNTATLTLSGHTGTVQRWQFSSTSNFSSATNESNTTTSLNTPNLQASRFYRAVVKSGTCNEANSTASQIIVNQTYTWEGDISTNFGTANNWIEGCVPHTGADISFRTTSAPDRICVLDQNRSLRNITIGGSTSNYVLHLNNYTLTTTGTLSTSGANIDARDDNATLTFAGTTAQSLPSGSLVNNEIARLTINNSAGVSLGGTTNLTRVLTLSSGTLTTNSHLTFKSTADYTAQLASVPASGSSISGNVTVEKYVKARRAFRLLGATVNTAGSIKANWQENGTSYSDDPNPGFGTHITGNTTGANGLDATQTGNPSLFTYDNANQSWSAITNTTSTTLEVGKAYRLMVRGGRGINIYQADNNPTPTNTTLRATGTMHTGNFSFNNLNSTPGADNFIVNPYQCAVDLSAIITSANTNLDYAKVYMWDPFINTRGAWATVTLSNNNVSPSGSSASKYLQPGQAFFVKTDLNATGAPSILFTENHKYTGGSFRTENLLEVTSDKHPKINITLVNLDSNVVADETTIQFGSNFSHAITRADALKFWNLDEVLGTVVQDKVLAINATELPKENTIIPIHVAQYRATRYAFRIHAKELQGFDVLLHDKEQKRYYNILSQEEENEIPFSQNKSDARRFELLIQPRFELFGLQNDRLHSNHMAQIFPNPTNSGWVNINWPHEHQPIKTIEITDITGRILYSTILDNPNSQASVLQFKFPELLHSGYYLMNLSGTTFKESHKIFLSK
jgi:hypothetical protein